MNKKLVKQVLTAIVLLVIFLISKDFEEKESSTSSFRNKNLVLTKHAKCRMGCRKIDRSEVIDVLLNGKINQRKSDLTNTPCPKYALESRSKQGQSIRLIVGDCPKSATIITAIDLEKSWNCNCK